MTNCLYCQKDMGDYQYCKDSSHTYWEEWISSPESILINYDDSYYEFFWNKNDTILKYNFKQVALLAGKDLFKDKIHDELFIKQLFERLIIFS